MLKMIGRILIILLVAGALGGGLYALVNSGAGQSALAGGQDGQHPRKGFAANLASNSSANSAAGFNPDFQPGLRQGFEGHDGASGGLDSLWKNLGLMALITAGVVVLQKLVRLALRRSPVPVS
jgi:hypothetical protein